MEGQESIMNFGGPTVIAIVLHLLTLITSVALLGLSIYCLILFIKLARRGIKALDYYIEENKDDK